MDPVFLLSPANSSSLCSPPLLWVRQLWGCICSLFSTQLRQRENKKIRKNCSDTEFFENLSLKIMIFSNMVHSFLSSSLFFFFFNVNVIFMIFKNYYFQISGRIFFLKLHQWLSVLHRSLWFMEKGVKKQELRREKYMSSFIRTRQISNWSRKGEKCMTPLALIGL